MKRLTVLLFFCIQLIINAQFDVGAIKLGTFNPSATEAGFIIGYEGGWHIDDNFLFGWSADWFHRNYVDRRLIAQYNEFFGPIQSELNEMRARTNLHSIPLMVSVNANLVTAPRIRTFFTGSAGIEVLLIFYRNYQNPQDNEFDGAFDFSWRLGGGISYQLGRRSDAFVELTYHNSKPSYEYEVRDNSTGRTRIFERSFDMSGLMMRVGFRFFF
ncbi:MAG: hypothetical protein AB1432_12800 [Bacteroidota bacterium]